MNYFKWILGGIAMMISTIVAYKLSEKYRVRRKFYEDFYLFNKRVVDEMSFTRNSLLTILSSFDMQSQFGAVLNTFRTALSERTNFSCENLWFLKEDEKRSAEEYFSSLGKTDAQTQMRYLKHCDDLLKTSAEKALAEKNKYVPMYIKLGLLAGVAVFILIL